MVSGPGRDKNLLGKPHWDGVPPAPRGMPQIEATFDTEGKTFTTYEDTAVVMINKSEGAWGPPQRWPQSTTVPPCSHRQRHKPHQCYNQCYDVNGVNGDSCSRGLRGVGPRLLIGQTFCGP